MNEPLEAPAWLRSVVRVGDGRGFVIETKDEQRLVVTAAHCLTRGGEPYLPPAQAAWSSEECTYAQLLGPLNAELTVWAECFFVDPVADLAVLGTPDNRDLWDEAEAYGEFVEETVPLALGTLLLAPERRAMPDGYPIWGPHFAKSDAWLLALSGQWFSCRVTVSERIIEISNAAEGIRGGMSGSPIIAPDGRAIGIICIPSGGSDLDGHRAPYLPGNLPGWLVQGSLHA